MSKFSTTLLTATMAGILSTSAIAADYNFKFNPLIQRVTRTFKFKKNGLNALKP